MSDADAQPQELDEILRLVTVLAEQLLALEIIDEKDWSTVWDEQFPTPENACRAFYAAADEEGMASFVGDSGPTVH
ncbi:hypothetical protein [Methylobacterium sp. E-066]|uniref:hypothetical protein n=1 Tax=Methylobacterium sp. E-066 TaxID=2836584 RepID=UPI001FBAED23|nr:hypothetical protein [Methylobacterium sp. E-066]MCJ2139456.1 hypothetical protein [Methylobacterium sp. E-066]